MFKTEITLSDGRRLIYFDQTPGDDRARLDSRGLEPATNSSQLRFDPLSRRWVAIAGHRQNRTHMPTQEQCPLCPTTPNNPSEVPASNYEVVVFENRFPSFDFNSQDSLVNSGDLGPYGLAPGLGTCEVICFTSQHDSSVSQLSQDRIRLIVDVWTDRTTVLAQDRRIEQIFCFENKGPEIGVTEPHPHGQIYGYPFVPPRVQQMIDSALKFQDTSGRNLFDEIVEYERSSLDRRVSENESWIAFVPFSAKWPYEVHLYPKVRAGNFSRLTDNQREDLAPIYLDLLKRYDRLFAQPAPYIAGWYQYTQADHVDIFGMHLEVFTIKRDENKLKFQAGSEASMDVFISDIVPEDAARKLRELS